MAEKLILKKYANRRLYDTEKSAYVTLSQVAEMIKQGREVEVIDVETNMEVTAFILTQIVLEEAKKKTVFLPVTFLYLFIRYGDNVLSEFFEKYLEQTFNNYLAYKATVDEQFRNWLELGQDFSTLTQKAVGNLTPFQSWMQIFPGTLGKKETDEGEEDSSAPDRSAPGACPSDGSCHLGSAHGYLFQALSFLVFKVLNQ